MRSDYFRGEGSLKLVKGALENTVIQSEPGVRQGRKPPLLCIPPTELL